MNSKAAYRAFLKTPFWLDLTARKKALVGGCERCGSKKKIQSHHKTYRKNWMDTRLEDLEVLCRRCHGREHGLKAFPTRISKIVHYRECKVFNETVHRCKHLKKMLSKGVPLRDRDRAFLLRSKELFPPKKGDAYVRFHVDNVLRTEIRLREEGL